MRSACFYRTPYTHAETPSEGHHYADALQAMFSASQSGHSHQAILTTHMQNGRHVEDAAIYQEAVELTRK